MAECFVFTYERRYVNSGLFWADYWGGAELTYWKWRSVGGLCLYIGKWRGIVGLCFCTGREEVLRAAYSQRVENRCIVGQRILE